MKRGKVYLAASHTQSLALSLGYRNNCFYGKEALKLNLFFYLLLTAALATAKVQIKCNRTMVGHKSALD